MREASNTMRSVAQKSDGGRPSLDQIWAWLAEVPDPEIPVVSVVDLGIVRDVAWSEDDPELACVTVTPTYSGCPATEVIGRMILTELLERGIKRVALRVQLSPPWTTDWLTERAKQKLNDYGIAPPTKQATGVSDPLAASLFVLGQGPETPAALLCPRCGSTRNETISRFGSTPCKALHRCLDCREPFDHFKCH
ncbi:MAG: phenylacetate-CoA oxygenase subunit PaaJ [Acidobacteriota bacterium]|nr:phenylacetate-CoA oxygenase subunit PaaJ [Acidobacteriota bacterium]